jgi:hypothetical protein
LLDRTPLVQGDDEPLADPKAVVDRARRHPLIADGDKLLSTVGECLPELGGIAPAEGATPFSRVVTSSPENGTTLIQPWIPWLSLPS